MYYYYIYKEGLYFYLMAQIALLQSLALSTTSPCLQQPACQCQVCRAKRIARIQVNQSDVRAQNSLGEFIKCLSVDFSCWIVSTVIIAKKQNSPQLEYHYYYNNPKPSQKPTILHKQLANFSTLPMNLHLYHQSSSIQLPKFQLIPGKVELAAAGLYIQGYEPTPPIKVEYRQRSPLGESLLEEYLEREEDRFGLQGYTLNEQFLQFVYNQYGQQIFCNYLTEYYCRLHAYMTQHIVEEGIFYYVIEPLPGEKMNSNIVSNTAGTNTNTNTMANNHPGQQYNNGMNLSKPKHLRFKPKLMNIRGLKMKLHQKYYSFQEQYTIKIKDQIQKVPKMRISPVSNTQYKGRLEKFKNKVRETYSNEQDRVMGLIEEEKSYEFQHDSDEMAKLLIPNMGNYKNLRQVLNSEQAFMKVFFKTKWKKMQKQKEKDLEKQREREIRRNKLISLHLAPLSLPKPFPSPTILSRDISKFSDHSQPKSKQQVFSPVRLRARVQRLITQPTSQKKSDKFNY